LWNMPTTTAPAGCAGIFLVTALSFFLVPQNANKFKSMISAIFR
jgi:hypothetical protein